MFFKDIPGHKELKERLLRAADTGQQAHARLLLGKKGGPQLALALALARYLHCTGEKRGDACGTCPSCHKYRQFVHPDLHFVFPVASTKKISSKPLSRDFLPEWRQFLQDKPYGDLSTWLSDIGAENKAGNISVEESRQIIQSLSLKAFEGSFKIMLLWLPEVMNIQAANAILKILEEPSARTLFLLVSQDASKLLTTILSRTQMIQVPAFKDEEVKAYVQEHLQLDDQSAQNLAFLAEGDLHKALELSRHQQEDYHEGFREWMRHCYKRDILQLGQLVDAFQKMSKDQQKGLLQYALSTTRESLIFKSGQSPLLRISEDKMKFVQGFSKTLGIDQHQELYQYLNEMLYYLERNANPKIAFMSLSLKIGGLFS